MKRLSTLASVLIIAAFMAAPVHAAKDCKAGKDPKELTQDEMRSIYDCFRPGLVKGYQKKGKNAIAMAYTDWKAVSTAPAAPPPPAHSGQYLMTYVNPVGYDAYVAFRTEGVDMPIGTLIAKENFSFKSNGNISKGALLMMEKVGLDNAPDTGGWIYSGIKPNGKKLKVNQKGFCQACHQLWPGQDFLGYPMEAVRVSSN